MASADSPAKLTTWAGESAHPAARFVRTTLGPLLLMIVTPPAAIVFWIVCTHLGGSLSALLTAGGLRTAAAHFPWPTWSAAAIIAVFLAVELALLAGLPGKIYEGPLSPTGARPRYKLNGVAAFFVTLMLFEGASRGAHLFSPGIVWDHFGAILSTIIVFALFFCLLLYWKGKNRPSTGDSSSSGNFIFDYYWGTELHPSVLGVNLKQLLNCRFGMMGWAVIVVSFAEKQAELRGGRPTLAMLVCAGLQLVYIFKFFWWESGYFTSLDIMHDRFGYYICWGVMCWIAAVYTLSAQYHVLQAKEISAPYAAFCAALGLASIWANYAADAQRQRVRATDGDTTVWGKRPEIVRARYRTADGKEHESLLLASGYWGVARHFHYVPEILLALAWSLPAGLEHFVPYFYVTFLTILLLDRAVRDDKRCRRKYGAAWEEYCRRVPYKVVPFVY
jgi:7-dehydrocholesterol reductase